MNAPPLGLTLPCRITAIHDGDTATVVCELVAHVRFDDCWAPELKESGGPESRDNITQFIGGKGRLHIPADRAKSVGDLFAIGARPVGEIWLDGMQESLSQFQVRTEHASTKKGLPLGQ